MLIWEADIDGSERNVDSKNGGKKGGTSKPEGAATGKSNPFGKTH